MLFNFKVIELADVTDIEPLIATAFFMEVIYRHTAKIYQEENTASYAIPESGDPLIVDLLVQCI